MIRFVAVALAVLIVLVPLVPSTISAQRDRGAAPSRGPGWLARESYLPAAQYKVTPAELTTVVNRLTEIERLFLQIDEIARPAGFEIESKFSGFTPRESVVSYSYEATFYYPTLKTAGEGTSCFWIEINPVPAANATGYHDAEAELMFEDEQGELVPGSTHVWKRLSPTERSLMDLMFTAGKVSPLEPVSRERYLRAKIFTDSENETRTRAATAESSYDRWIADAPTRKQQREGLRTALPAAQAATLIKTMEDDERKVTAELKATDASERAETAKLIGVYTQSVARSRAQLASMSAAERSAPAWLERRGEVLEKLDPTLVPFVAPLTPLSGRVVVGKLDLYKGRTSRVDARVMRVHLSASLTCNVPAVHRAIYQVWKKLDWAALARVVDSR